MSYDAPEGAARRHDFATTNIEVDTTPTPAAKHSIAHAHNSSSNNTVRGRHVHHHCRCTAKPVDTATEKRGPKGGERDAAHTHNDTPLQPGSAGGQESPPLKPTAAAIAALVSRDFQPMHVNSMRPAADPYTGYRPRTGPS